MAHQSPMISIPRKSTDEVDWTTPIRNLIAQSYGESPDNYATECASLQRCRQDAVRGAGSDTTARDLLYKYFGQLELLELRFSEIRVHFPWRDAFTNKLITQTSIAYEKASILFQIAATHSAIASSQSRSDPEGIKRAFYFFRTCAGMLTYINENFLHAPSTDLSREVVKFLVSVILAQATEVFFEKCVDEKKGSALVSKIASQTAYMYTTLTEEVKEFMGKGIFERNWVSLIQIKAKYFSSLAQYHRALADSASSKYGDALARLALAETHGKEASRLAASFASSFTSATCPTLPADAGSSIAERTKAHLALVTDKKAEAQRENDLIYNAVLPAPEALPNVDKTAVATPIPIQEVYGTPEVQKTIGQDIFIRLIPLSVHESASVYSEEKAKLVRGEVEKAEGAEGEVRSALESMGVKSGLVRFRAMAEGDLGSEDEVPVDVRRWKEDITLMEEREPVEGIMRELGRLKDSVKQELDDAGRDLEVESRECEMLRVKYDHQWTQDPSSGLTKDLRTDLKSHYGSLEAASKSDQQVIALWESVKGDVRILMSPEVENIFRASTEKGAGDSLLDLDVGEGDDSRERAKIGQLVNEIDERLGRLNKISRERNEVLKDLKEKIQTDDVSHLLLLNRRNTGVEPALFAAELEKFRPYQQRLAATVQHQNMTLQEVSSLWKTLRDAAGRGPGARKWEEREKRKKDTVKRFSRARDGYMEVKDGLAKGLHFYGELTQLTSTLRKNVKSFVTSRATERESLISKLEVEKRLSAASSPPPLAAKPPVPPPPSGASDLASSFGSMNIRNTPPIPTASPPVPPGPQSYHSRQGSLYSQPQPPSPAGSAPPPPSQYNLSPAPQAPNTYSPSPSLPPPPPQHQPSSYMPPPPKPQSYQSYSSPPPPPQSDPYASLGMFNPASGSSLSTTSPPPQQQQHYSHMPPVPSAPPSAPPPPPQHQYNYNQYQYQPQPQQQQQQQQYGFPPPPAPSQQQGGYGGYGQGYGVSSPPPPQQQQQTGGYSGFPPPPPSQGYGGYNYGQQ
ncbi:bck1-like resistance to osmotic shock [Stygiomarasmius scandens]|uniref:BRO domain-containing protein 1 n=1 Tax=Marasmiellus scandens TaxID=2682957 RepID=A0ABR1JID3_9AGAR